MPQAELSSEELQAFYLLAINKCLAAHEHTEVNGSKAKSPQMTASRVEALLIEPFSSNWIGGSGGSRSHDIGPNLVVNGSTTSHHLEETLQNSASDPKNHACQRCYLQGLHRDQQRPSCRIFQQYSAPYYYEHDGGRSPLDHHFRESFYDSLEQQDGLPWEETLKINSYQNLDPALRRNGRPRRSRRRRLSKPQPQELFLDCDTGEIVRHEETPLLINYKADTPLRVPSPTTSAPLSTRLSVSRPKSSCSSNYLNSMTYFESKPSTSSCRSTAKMTPPSTRRSITQTSEEMGTPWCHAPKPFQCTFCLQQCEDIDDWEHHEFSEHIPDKIWICMPWGPVEEIDGRDLCVFCGLENPTEDHHILHDVEACYCEEKPKQLFATKDALVCHLSAVHNQREETPVMTGWTRPFKGNGCLWNCGFCDEVMTSWAKRVEHIGGHFKNGMVMSFWDPLIPSYPQDRSSLRCITGFPPLIWDAKILWDLERNRVGFSWIPQPFRCQYCVADICFRDKTEADRHESIWHTRREVWACPTIRDIQNSFLSTHFFPTKSQPISPDKNTCCFCKNDFQDKVHSLSRERVWDLRLAHLEDHHNFGACQPVFKSARAGDLLFHLANIHHVSLNRFTADVLESCRREDGSLAKRLISKT